MKELYKNLIENNRKWVAEKLELDPEYFEKLAKGQKPPLLWIGCADSRVPANEITGTQPGEVFVHRNIANMVVHTDMNMLSVLDYAVNVLEVKHVIVCGHYGCGGVLAAMGNEQYGLLDNWIRNIKDVYRLHSEELNNISDDHDRAKRLVELNVEEQVYNLSKTSIIQNAWKKNQFLEIHGWVYALENGLVHDLEITVSDTSEMSAVYRI